ncbi:MAG: YopX family protein [Dissulfurispiraceae bacterium]
MERRIIFRTWDKKNRQMLYNPAGNIDFGTWWNERCLNDPGMESEIIFMQFAGLYDRSGKEIFEGDIINYQSATDTYERAMVHYLNRYVCFGVGKDIPLRSLRSIEVIGNIFENPQEVPDECDFPIGTRTNTLFNVLSEKNKYTSRHK